MTDPFQSSTACTGSHPLRSLVLPVVVAALVAFLWAFPSLWNQNRPIGSDFVWFGENPSVDQWTYHEIPVAQSAEAVLAADRIANGSFEKSDGSRVSVYSAKRYGKKDNEIGLFSHTPDRCWTIAGWQLEPVAQDCENLTIHGLPIMFERRIFNFNEHRELVYFTALVGGKPLPYRIDQYFAAARKKTKATQDDTSSTWLRLAYGRLWGWAWESMKNRTPLFGPQQFVRVSTPVEAGDVAAADQRLKTLLPQWMVLTNFNAEAAYSKQKVANSKAEIGKEIPIKRLKN